MTKELKALKELFDAIKKGYSGLKIMPTFQKDKDIIETALKREDSIEITAIDIEQENQALCKENKKLKRVLKIIKKKNVNVRAFKKVLLMKQNDDVKLRVYNSQNDKDEDDLTKEEFDLLKEVLL